MASSKAIQPQTLWRWPTTAGLSTQRPSTRILGRATSINYAASQSSRTYHQPPPRPSARVSRESSRTTAVSAFNRTTMRTNIMTSSKPPFFPESASDPYAATKEPIIHDIFEPVTGTWQYVVADPSTLVAAVIDPVLDFDPVTQAITTTSADALLALVEEKGYEIERLLETHAHADHLTASTYLQRRLAESQGYKPLIGIGKRIGMVQDLFGKRYGIPEGEIDHVFDRLFEDDEEFTIGSMKATAIHLPGHTPDHLGYRIGDNVFCGDSLFHADIGTARCDFPGGSAENLYDSGRRLLSLPSHVKIWTGHDYPPKERSAAVPFMTVQEHRASNKHLKDGVSKEEFVELRNKRDSSLGAPRLLHQSLQINIRAGQLPEPTEGGYRVLRLPLKLGELKW